LFIFVVILVVVLVERSPDLDEDCDEDYDKGLRLRRFGRPPRMTSQPSNTSSVPLIGVVSLFAFGCVNCLSADVAERRGRPLIGVQRWDMYSGKGYTYEQELGYLPGKQGFLKPAEWHDRAPFFCRLTKDVDWVEHPPNAGPLWFNYPFRQELLQKSMDQEIRYAYNAGIDFFIYHGPAAKVSDPHAWHLKHNLNAHMTSKIPEAKKMKFVWALYSHKALKYTRSKVALMMDEVIEYIKMPNWQKVMDDRPLVPVLWPENFNEMLEGATGEERMTDTEFVDYIRARVRAAGLKPPYVVGMANSNGHRKAALYKKWGYDAFMDYDGSYGGRVGERDRGPTYAEATDGIIAALEKHWSPTGLPYIPPFSSMQYCFPRSIDKDGNPVTRRYHYQWPRKGDMAARIKAAFDYVAAHPKECEAQALSRYSWNEFSEGGGLCPTMGKPPEYEPVTTWLDEVAGALKAWEYPVSHGDRYGAK